MCIGYNKSVKKAWKLYCRLWNPPWLMLMIIVYLVLTYGHRWFGLLGSALIILLGWKTWPDEWKKRLGLLFDKKSPVITFFTVLAMTITTHYLVPAIAAAQQVIYHSWLTKPDIPGYFHSFSQTLNEELILGALLLFTLRKHLPQYHPVWLSLFAAAGFALLHYPFYAWAVTGFHRGEIRIWALLSLFAIGVVRNNLILTSGHIGYAWAMHFGFNIVFFRGSFYDPVQANSLNQPAMFNLVLGSPYFLAGTMVLLMLSLFLYRPHRYDG